jgi:DNA-binding CsgD family transcriptional regulator
VIVEVSPAPSSPLVGRHREQAVIGAMLDRATDRGACLVIRGAPGVGKSALLEWASFTSGGRFGVQRAVGTVSEFGLPYAALHQALRPVLGHMERLNAHHRRALEVALGRASDAAPDLYAVAMAALELYAEVANERPVLLLADDVQWMDPSSQQVLAFVARRISSDRVVMLATHRDNEDGPLLDTDIPTLDLAPLDPQSAMALLDQASGQLDARTRTFVLDAARGNPLALLELPRTLDLDDPSHIVEAEQIPLTARLQNSFLARIDDLDTATVAALQMAALSDSYDIAEVVAATKLLAVRDATPALDPAVAAGLIIVKGTAIRFRHPLIQSALLQRIGADTKRECHAALAQVLHARPDRAMWHRASATLGPDAALAAELERHAVRAVERGAPTNAVWALERAAQLSPDSYDRRQRTYQAAALAYDVGLVETGERLRTEYRELTVDDHDDLRYEWLTELISADSGGTVRIQQLLDLARRATVLGDVELAMAFLRASALRCWNLYPGRPIGKEVIVTANDLAVADVVASAQVLAYASPFDSAETVRHLIRQVPRHDRDPTTGYRLAHAAACAGAFDVSETLLSEAAEGLRADGRLHTLGKALSLLSWSAMRRGHWSASVRAAEEGARLCAETRQPFWEASALLARAVVVAFQGDFDAAEHLIVEAEHVDLQQLATVRAATLVARAAVAAGRGHHDQAFASLAQLHDPAQPTYHPAHALWSLASMAEAAAASGHVDGARMLVVELPQEVRETTSPTGRMNLTFAGAVLAAEDLSAQRFEDALALDMANWPYEGARLQLAYGRWLRRQRRVRESRDFLRSARDGFDNLGARPLAVRAREELRAAGERSDSPAVNAWDALSPQELQIASMVAEGLSNRDIGKRLFISHRTVGSHLYRIFPKLDVTSRGELQRLAADHNLPRE